MALTISIKGNARKVLRAVGEIISRPFGGSRGRQVQRQSIKVFEQQFQRGGYFGPSGALIRWPPTQPFGTRAATVPTLGGSSSSLLAAARGGPGGSWSVGPKRLALTVSLVYWPVHDKGARIPVTARSRGFVGFTFGVQFRKDKTHVVIPRRRLIDARAPQFIQAGREVVVEAIRKEAR